MYVPPNRNRPGLKALKAQAQARAEREAQVKATQAREAMRKVAGQ